MWSPWLFRHGAVDPCEGSLFRANADERISKFTHFYLVIRLRIVKQSAIPFASNFVPLLPSLLQHLGNLSSAQAKLYGTARNLFFDALLTVPHAGYIHAWFQATGMSFSCRRGLLGIWWGWQVVHLIREDLHSCLMPTCGLTDDCPFEGITHGLAFRNGIPHNFVVSADFTN